MVQDLWEYPTPEDDETEQDTYTESMPVNAVNGYPECDAPNTETGGVFSTVEKYYDPLDETASGPVTIAETDRYKNKFFGVQYLVTEPGQPAAQAEWASVDRDRWNLGIRMLYRIFQKLQRFHFLSGNYSHGTASVPAGLSGDEYGALDFDSRHTFAVSETGYNDTFTVSWNPATSNGWPFRRNYNGTTGANTNRAISTSSAAYGGDGSSSQVLDFEITGESSGVLYLLNPIIPSGGNITVAAHNQVQAYGFPQVWDYENHRCIHSVPVEHSILSSFKSVFPNKEISPFISGKYYCDLFRYVHNDEQDNPRPSWTEHGCIGNGCPYADLHKQSDTLITDAQAGALLFARGLNRIENLESIPAVTTYSIAAFDGLLALMGALDLQRLFTEDIIQYWEPNKYLLQRINEDDITEPGYSKTFGHLFTEKPNYYLNYLLSEKDEDSLFQYIEQREADKIVDRNGDVIDSAYEFEIPYQDESKVFALSKVSNAAFAQWDRSDAVPRPKPRKYSTTQTVEIGADGTVGDEEYNLKYQTFASSQSLNVDGTVYSYNLKIELSQYGLFLNDRYKTAGGSFAPVKNFEKQSGENLIPYSISPNGDLYDVSWTPKIYAFTTFVPDGLGGTMLESFSYTNPQVVVPDILACSYHPNSAGKRGKEYGAMVGDVVVFSTALGDVCCMVEEVGDADGVTYGGALAPTGMTYPLELTQWSKNNFDSTSRTRLKVYSGQMSWVSAGETTARLFQSTIIPQAFAPSDYSGFDIRFHDGAGGETDLSSDVVFVDKVNGVFYLNTTETGVGYITADVIVQDTRKVHTIEDINALETTVNHIIKNGYVDKTNEITSLSGDKRYGLIPVYWNGSKYERLQYYSRPNADEDQFVMRDEDANGIISDKERFRSIWFYQELRRDPTDSTKTDWLPSNDRDFTYGYFREYTTPYNDNKVPDNEVQFILAQGGLFYVDVPRDTNIYPMNNVMGQGMQERYIAGTAYWNFAYSNFYRVSANSLDVNSFADSEEIYKAWFKSSNNKLLNIANISLIGQYGNPWSLADRVYYNRFDYGGFIRPFDPNYTFSPRTGTPTMYNYSVNPYDTTSFISAVAEVVPISSSLLDFSIEPLTQAYLVNDVSKFSQWEPKRYRRDADIISGLGIPIENYTVYNTSDETEAVKLCLDRYKQGTEYEYLLLTQVCHNDVDITGVNPYPHSWLYATNKFNMAATEANGYPIYDQVWSQLESRTNVEGLYVAFDPENMKRCRMHYDSDGHTVMHNLKRDNSYD